MSSKWGTEVYKVQEKQYYTLRQHEMPFPVYLSFINDIIYQFPDLCTSSGTSSCSNTLNPWWCNINETDCAAWSTWVLVSPPSSWGGDGVRQWGSQVTVTDYSVYLPIYCCLRLGCDDNKKDKSSHESYLTSAASTPVFMTWLTPSAMHM